MDLIWVMRNLVNRKYWFFLKIENQVREIDLEKTDFIENAKFATALANKYFLLKKVVFQLSFFFSLVFYFLEWKDRLTCLY